jgi:hypothetical protein
MTVKIAHGWLTPHAAVVIVSGVLDLVDLEIASVAGYLDCRFVNERLSQWEMRAQNWERGEWIRTDKTTLVHLGLEGSAKATSSLDLFLRVLTMVLTNMLTAVIGRSLVVDRESSIDRKRALVVDVTLNPSPGHSTIDEGDGSHRSTWLDAGDHGDSWGKDAAPVLGQVG